MALRHFISDLVHPVTRLEPCVTEVTALQIIVNLLLGLFPRASKCMDPVGSLVRFRPFER